MNRDVEAIKGAAAWMALPPRYGTRAQLVQLIGGEPAQFSGAICVACDTRLYEELCTPDSKPGQVIELRHWAEFEFALIRPSELRLLSS
jgi:hypothetical protein